MIPQSVRPASRLLGAPASGAWAFAELAGYLAELSGQGATATVTAALRLAWEAQCQGEPVAWVTATTRCFYPPDAIDNGLDLDALAVVRVPDAPGIGRAADTLVRSGAFGLVVLDLGCDAALSEKQLTRLLGLARKHGTAIVCLTAKPDAAPSLGGLVSMRASVERDRAADDGFAWRLTALKDKRRAPGWQHQEACYGPAGLH